MRRTSSIALASLVALLVGSTAGAQLPVPSFSSSPFVTSGANGLSSRPWIAQKNIVTAALNSDPLYRTPLGTGYDGVGFLIIERPDLPAGFVAICSGALLNGGANVLTAAHCLADDTGHMIATKVTAQFLPSTGGVETITASTPSNFHVNPQYTGEVIDAHDIAVIRLDNAASAGVQRYGLYSGPTQGVQFDVTGFGRRGVGNTGETTGVGVRLHGANNYDFSFTDPQFGGFFSGFFGNADPDVLVSDFDNGQVANDASCWLGGFFGISSFCNLGLGEREVNIGSGDSGGPAFINGQIASVNSFSLSFGAPPDIDEQLNSSFGEFAGYTSVQLNQGWLNAVAPEPGTLLLAATGLVGVAVFARRRRRERE